LKLAVQLSRLPSGELEKQFSMAKAIGFDAVEVPIGPSLDLDQHAAEIAAAIKATGVPVCAICTHSMHDPIHPDPSERARRFAVLTRVLELAEELGAGGVVSVPIRHPLTFPDHSASDFFLFAAAELTNWTATLPDGKAALFLEPLNRYEAGFLRRVEQAVELAKAVNHPRVQALADLFHMNIEEANMGAPVLVAKDHLGHVHIADNNRLQPGAGCLDLRPTFRALKEIEYTGYISIECSALGGPQASEGALVILGISAKYMRAEWARA